MTHRQSGTIGRESLCLLANVDTGKEERRRNAHYSTLAGHFPTFVPADYPVGTSPSFRGPTQAPSQYLAEMRSGSGLIVAVEATIMVGYYASRKEREKHE